VDPHHLDADPDPARHFHADPDPDPARHFDADPDPDPACHFHADPDLSFHFDADLDPSFQKGSTLKKCLNRLICHTFWLVICKLMWIRIRIQLIALIQIRILPFNLSPCLIRIWNKSQTLFFVSERNG
jgi:hypothetical protein